MERLTTYSGNKWERATLRVKNQDLIDKLAEYEDLEEQGLLLKLPCKVGDKVFLVDFEEDEMDEATVEEIMLDSDGLFLNTDYECYVSDGCDYLFLTKEEAEKALAKLSEVE